MSDLKTVSAPRPPYQKLSDRVITVLGLNPGPYTLDGTNTYIVGTGKKRILIDTGEGIAGYLTNLQKVLKENDCEISEILITHHHTDHIGGISDVLKLDKDIKLYKYQPSELELKTYPYQALRDGQVITTDGASLEVIYSPGHCPDHVAFFLREEKKIFSGDCVLGSGTTVFTDLYTYMKSLEKLLQFHPQGIYPAHGPYISDGQERIKEYIKHRLAREAQIVKLLEEKKTALTSREIVDNIYVGLSPSLVFGAEKNVQLHLGKLEQEKRVAREGQGWLLKHSNL